MISKIFKIECLTNLHVGNGDANFSIIDNEVERDSVTGYPTINSSGVKGALKEHLKCKGWNKLEEAFGGEGDMKQGNIKFLSANMLAVPMRVSSGNDPYALVTTEAAVMLFNKLNEELKCGAAKINTSGNGSQIEVEGKTCPLTAGLGGVGITSAAVMKSDDFKSVSLPVVARNRLENGKSENLWYEEIVPHESVFTFAVITNDDQKELLKELAKMITEEPVQFGGNATVGCGLCKITETGGGLNE